MKRFIKITNLLLVLFLLSSTLLSSQIRLPQLITDGVVLQHGTPLTIWGWASPNESISLVFNGETYNTKATSAGQWELLLPAQEAGGEFTMLFTGKNKIEVKNILFGDVWLCSGQSNMELPLARVKVRYEELLSQSSNTSIRLFEVPDRYDFNSPQNDLPDGRWMMATQDDILKFSAIAYFFASELYQEYNIPIGLINASLGGSPVQSWMSEESLKSFPKDYQTLQDYKDSTYVANIIRNDRDRANNWYKTLQGKDEGYKNGNTWKSSQCDDSNWNTMTLPGYWKDEELGAINGSVWFRKRIHLTKSATSEPALLVLGRIVDADSVFINGIFVGNTTYQYPPRRYNIPQGVLKTGDNTIVIRVINNIGNGGFFLDKEYALHCGEKTINLEGEWKYRLGATMPALQSQTFVRWKPAGLYNAMINPLLKMNIKGAIWYQGESNADEYALYQQMFSTMIVDWRKRWNIGNFPFLYVQLANFMSPNEQTEDTDWSKLRQAQLETLSVPNTAMAVIIDAGEWNDIHPLNKQVVGERLAYAAQKWAYGNDTVVYSGPQCDEMRVEDNSIVLSFSHIGSGLVAKGSDTLTHFSIAGNDKVFHWATAKIKGDQVMVWSKDVPNPIAVRYAWSNNPQGCNFYNAEGLPASPFELYGVK